MERARGKDENEAVTPRGEQSGEAAAPWPPPSADLSVPNLLPTPTPTGGHDSVSGTGARKACFGRSFHKSHSKTTEWKGTLRGWGRGAGGE